MNDSRWIIMAAVACLLIGGCQQQMARIFYQPQAPKTAVVEEYVALAADTGDSPERVYEKWNSDTSRERAGAVLLVVQRPLPYGRGSETAPASVASGPSTRPAAGTYYTVPTSEIQRLTFMTMLGATPAAPGRADVAKEASESSLAALGGTGLATGGLAGLGAPQPRTLTAVVGQPGLQRGFAAGLGFARPNTIFTPRANPLSGPTGRCQELIRAGLFPNQTACMHYFGK